MERVYMNVKKILQTIRNKIDLLVHNGSPAAHALWNKLIALHPADIADFFTDLNHEAFLTLFPRLPKKIHAEVFELFSDSMKVKALSCVDEPEEAELLRALPPDKLTDLFDYFSDEELNVYLRLLNKRPREQVTALMKFHPESAGGIMDIEVLTLMQDFSVERSIQLLQRLRLSKDIYQTIYVTDLDHMLVGHIKLEDLVLQLPKTRISTFMQKNQYVAQVDEDRENIAERMIHYGLMNVPVVSKNGLFLGAIPGETLIGVVVEEAGEDVLKMSALIPVKGTYFESSFFKVFFERGIILTALLIAQSFSAKIMQSYESTLQIGSLWIFITTLISAGGNSSNQTSAVVIQGIAAGEIRPSNVFRFLKREVLMAIMLALLLGLVVFARAYLTSMSFIESSVVAVSLSLIVVVAVILGSCIPVVLKRFHIDPAYSAGPFLATLMDILGVLIYCLISQFVLS